MSHWLCALIGHDDHWTQHGDYRVRHCQRCPQITAVVTWRQHPTLIDPEIGHTTSTQPDW